MYCQFWDIETLENYATTPDYYSLNERKSLAIRKLILGRFTKCPGMPI
jgi:hypothetical protein